MTRTPQEVFQHHAQALGAGDLDEIVADYTDDAVFVTPAGVQRGKDAIRAAFTRLLADVPNAAWDLKTQLYEHDVPASRQTGGDPSRRTYLDVR